MILALALVVAAATATAASPKTAEARKLFDRGVAAYTKKDYAGASDALGKSFAAEADVETLFAWAQAERQQDHCDKAIELYERLLKFDLPDENKRAVKDKLDECKALIVVTQDDPEPVEPAKGEPAPAKPLVVDKPVHADRPSRWKDPLGGVLVGAGAIGLGIGGYFLASASGASSDAKASTNYFETERLNDKADKHGTYGVLAAGAGAALVVGGIIRYATRGGSEHATTVSGWLAPDGGGIAALGRF